MRTLYQYLFTKMPLVRSNADGMLYLLTEEERGRIMRVQYVAIGVSVLFSVIGFVLLYLPQYNFKAFFMPTNVDLPYFGRVALPIVTTVYGVVLMVVEIMLLTLLHLSTVQRIAAITGYLGADMHQNDNIKTVLDVSLEVKSRSQEALGLDPYQDLNPILVFGYNFLLRLKGWLGSVVIKWFLSRMLGRFAVREVLDFSGLPIYAFLNGYATYRLLREARVVIMGQHLIERVLQSIDFQEIKYDGFENLIYDTLQFIVINKRDYHHNHYILAKNVLSACDIPPRAQYKLRDDYYTHLAAAPQATQRCCILLIHLGFLLDGELSLRERTTIQTLRKKGLITENINDVLLYLKSFLAGDGMQNLLIRYA